MTDRSFIDTVAALIWLDQAKTKSIYLGNDNAASRCFRLGLKALSMLGETETI